MATWLAKQVGALTKKGPAYWLRAIGTVIVGVWLGGCLGQTDCWREERRTAYRSLYKFSPRKSIPKWVTLILIEDDEYWLGDLAGRKPTKRDYLARLIREVATAEPKPAVIGLDFDLAAPSPDGAPIDHPDYRDETKTLLDTIREIGTRCPIVIAKNLGPPTERGYSLDSDIYDQYDFGNAAILKGYIGLPSGERFVAAVPMALVDGNSLDSFATAIVRTVHPEMLTKAEEGGETLPYADFMNLEQFTRVSARDVLHHDSSALTSLGHRLVIIGAHWHVGGLGRGLFVDLHPSPNGDMPGVALHANYIEAILDSRLHGGWSPLALHIIEGGGAALVALIFALELRFLYKALAVVGVAVGLFVLSVVSLLLLGLIFEFFVPVVSALGHGMVERVLEWRDVAQACAAKAAAENAP